MSFAFILLIIKYIQNPQQFLSSTEANVEIESTEYNFLTSSWEADADISSSDITGKFIVNL